MTSDGVNLVLFDIDLSPPALHGGLNEDLQHHERSSAGDDTFRMHL